MAKINLGKTLELQPKTIYIAINESPEDVVNFIAFDTFDYEHEEDIHLACLGRGMIEYAQKKTEDVAMVGRQALLEEGLLEETTTEDVLTKDGTVIQFPKPQGNA